MTDHENNHSASGPPVADEGDATLSVPGQATVAPSSHPRSQPSSIAGYRIIGELGEGGMGVVYEAEQERPRRRVALKVMRRDHLVDEVHTRMFFREAETLARLKHPNIAAIYASGHTDDGHDYFAMELVAGETLDRWLRGRPALVDGDELKLRLRLFRTLCDAVHYAHQRGVIHRDLKPSNIIVTEAAVAAAGSTSSAASPSVKILDFGLARITDSDIAATMVSEIGMIKGTLQYMSPEQARGDVAAIDVRSDVYALGVILYELVVGKRPYEVSRSALAEAVRVICEERPLPLQRGWSGAGRLDADLETIVGKALEKEMDRRYGSAAALGEDVARHLDRQPILARPPSATYQMRKFAARNRALVVGATTTLVVLIAGAVVSTTFALREAAQRRQAEQVRADLEVVVDFQSRMLASVDPEEMGRAMISDLRERVKGAARDTGSGEAQVEEAGEAFDELVRGVNATDAAMQVIDRQILERASRTIDSEFEAEPEIGLRLRATIGDTYGELGLLAQAEVQARAVVERSARLFGPEHPKTLEAGRVLAQELMFLGREDDAEAQVAAVLEIQRRVLGDSDPATLRSRRLLAVLEEERGRVAEAESALEEVLAEQRRTLGAEHADTMATMSSLALLYGDGGRAEAEVLMLELIAISERQWGKDHPKTLIHEHNLARVFMRQGRHAEAAERNRHVLEVRRRVLGEDHPRTLRTKASLADNYGDLGRLQESRALFAEILEDRRRTLGADHPDTIESTGSLAILSKQMGRFSEAEPLYEATLAGRRRVLGADHPRTLATMYGLADLYREMGRSDEAERLFLETIAIQERVFGSDNRQPLRSRMTLAKLYDELGRDREAEQLYLSTSEAQLRTLGQTDPESIDGVLNLASFASRHGRFDDAERDAKEALESAAEALGDDNEFTADAKLVLGFLRARQHRDQEAEALYREVLDFKVRTLGEGHVGTTDVLQKLACLYRDAGRYDEARGLFEEVVRVHEAAWGHDHPWGASALEDYAELLRLVGDDRAAAEIGARAR